MDLKTVDIILETGIEARGIGATWSMDKNPSLRSCMSDTPLKSDANSMMNAVCPIAMNEK
jgi:hypothetical protein